MYERNKNIFEREKTREKGKLKKTFIVATATYFLFNCFNTLSVSGNKKEQSKDYTFKEIRDVFGPRIEGFVDKNELFEKEINGYFTELIREGKEKHFTYSEREIAKAITAHESYWGVCAPYNNLGGIKDYSKKAKMLETSEFIGKDFVKMIRPFKSYEHRKYSVLDVVNIVRRYGKGTPEQIIDRMDGKYASDPRWKSIVKTNFHRFQRKKESYIVLARR